MSNQILWSKGPFITQYSRIETEKITSYYKIKQLIHSANGALWIRNTSKSKRQPTDLDFVAMNIGMINKPTILITTDGDRPVPSSYNMKTVQTILNHPYITAWYTQNYDRTIVHPKLKYIPIGLDFHTKKWLINDSINEKLLFMQRQKITKIKNKIFSDTHHSKTHVERTKLYNTLINNKNIDFLESKKSFIEITNLYNKYLFVISPRGAGFDCHRTWELFMAGCIVIVKTSSLDNMYIDNNLPVVILQDWEELNSDIENKLNIWETKHIQKTTIGNIYPRLMFSHWVKT